MKLGIYVRVSTDIQASKGVSLDNQIDKGVECSKKYMFDEYQIYKDAGLSGRLKHEDRPELNKLVKAIGSKEVQGVFIYGIDRLSRDFLEYRLLKELIIKNEIRLFDTSGEVDLASASADLLNDIKSLLGEFETKQLASRVKDNLLKSAEKGHAGGGPLLNYGYKKAEDRMLVVDEKEAETVRLIYQMCIDGKGSKVIANTLNEMSIPTKRNSVKKGQMKVKGKEKTEFNWRDAVIYRILTNPIYKGVRLYKGKELTAPAIIEPTIFDTVQEVLKEWKHNKDTTNKYFYLLKGKVICGGCYNRMYGRKREDLSDNQYICSSQRHKGEYCGTRGINIDFLNEMVWNYLLKLDTEVKKYFDWYESTDQIKMAYASLKSIRQKEVATSEKIEKLIDSNLEGNIKNEFYVKKMKELNDSLDKYREDKNKAMKALGGINDKEAIIETVKGYNDLLRTELNDEQKRSIILALVDTVHVVWNPDSLKHTVMIEYKIDRLSQYRINSNVEIGYNKMGWRLDKDKPLRNTIHIRKLNSEDLGNESITQLPSLRIS